MTKIDGRTGSRGRAADRRVACKRLQTDHIDLMQHHEVIRLEDPDRIFAEGGAHGGAARGQEGGQDPLHRLHRPQGSARPPAHAARWPREHGFHFDTVQMPLNVMDAHFRSFAHARCCRCWSSKASACSA